MKFPEAGSPDYFADLYQFYEKIIRKPPTKDSRARFGNIALGITSVGWRNHEDSATFFSEQGLRIGRQFPYNQWPHRLSTLTEIDGLSIETVYAMHLLKSSQVSVHRFISGEMAPLKDIIAQRRAIRQEIALGLDVANTQDLNNLYYEMQQGASADSFGPDY